MTENQNEFKEFRRSYDSWGAFQKIAKDANSENPEKRLGARNAALDFAAKHVPGLEAVVNDPIAREQIPQHIIDTYLATAIKYFGTETAEKIKNKGKKIIKDAPDKGLAAIVLGLEPCKIEGDDKHNEIAKIHARVHDFNSALGAYENDGKNGHAILYSVAAKHAEEEIRNNLAKNNPALKDNKEVIERLTATLLATLAVSERDALVYVASRGEKAKKEFEEKIGNEENKARYARETLTYLYDKGQIDKVADYLGSVPMK